MNSIEIKKGDIDFKYLWKIIKLDIDKVTFRKYNIRRLMSDRDGYEFIELTEDVGEETHSCKPEVIMQLAGKVGTIIKGFICELVGEKKDKVKIGNIVCLEEFKP
jgi:hypothetical protein